MLALHDYQPPVWIVRVYFGGVFDPSLAAARSPQRAIPSARSSPPRSAEAIRIFFRCELCGPNANLAVLEQLAAPAWRVVFSLWIFGWIFLLRRSSPFRTYDADQPDSLSMVAGTMGRA